MEVLLKRFCLSGHTIGFEAQFIVPCEGTTEEVPFEWSHHRIRSTDLKLQLRTKFIVPCESTAEEVPFEWSHHRI